MPRVPLLLLVLAVLAGCSNVVVRQPGTMDGPMIAQQDATRLDRLARSGQRVTPATSQTASIDIGLAARSALGAWSWPDGRIRASRALVDLLDDDELAAAVAHELGHLLDGGHIAREPAAPGGAHGGAGSEARADVIGCRILAERGVEPAALPRMLRDLAAGLADDADGIDPQLLLRRAAAADTVCVAHP